MGLEQSEIGNRSGPGLGPEGTELKIGHERTKKIVKERTKIETGAAKDLEKSGPRFGLKQPKMGQGTQTPRLGQEWPKTRT